MPTGSRVRKKPSQEIRDLKLITLWGWLEGMAMQERDAFTLHETGTMLQ